MKPADRKYLRFVIAAFVLLGLVGLGVYLYKPLRLRYVIYWVRNTTWDEARDCDLYYYRVTECEEAAAKGSRPAIDAVIEASGVGDGAVSEYTGDIAFTVAVAHPKAFFEVLGRRSDKRVMDVLADITNSCTGADLGGVFGVEYPSAKSLVAELTICATSQRPDVRRVAGAALEFTRRRFAKELAEAEAKAKKKADDN